VVGLAAGAALGAGAMFAGKLPGASEKKEQKKNAKQA
jgi:hypothetical protein